MPNSQLQFLFAINKISQTWETEHALTYGLECHARTPLAAPANLSIDAVPLDGTYTNGVRLPHSHGVGIEYSPLPGGSRLVSLHSFLLGLQLVPL